MTGEELASYYRAAVEFIDPRLGQDCPVEDICAAAKARQRVLAASSSETARLELDKITEALNFIERVHPEICTAENGLPPRPETSSSNSTDDELVELVIGGSGEATAAPPQVQPVLEEAMAPMELDTAVDAAVELNPVPVTEAANTVGEITIPVAEPAQIITADAEPELWPALSSDSATVDEPEAPALEVELAAFEAEEAQPVIAAVSRQQYIDDLHARREQRSLLDDQETAELIEELHHDTAAGELVNRMLEKVPDVQTALDREMQQEEARSTPLDFRSMIAAAQSSEKITVRPAGRRRVRTEEIMQRPVPEYRIPEEHAAPILLGLLLIAWQFSIALTAGYALCRLLVWPIGTTFASMPPLRAVLSCVVIMGSGALVALWFRHYRMRTHRLALAVHVTAASMLLLLLPWQLKAVDSAYASPPPMLLWGLLIAAWIVATVACWFHDLRVPPQSQATGDNEQPLPGAPKPAKPAIPQLH